MIQEIKEVFTKQYKADVKQMERKRSIRQQIKLRNRSERIDDKFKRLMELGYVSDCHFEVGGIDGTGDI